MPPPSPRRWFLLVAALGLGLTVGARATAADPPAKVYVILWFDTEDYILPASDDAALRVADWLSKEGVRATFKVVGEKARTLERRGRQDVIEALKKHEIGYHSNFHSTQPSPAMYLSTLGWDEAWPSSTAARGRASATCSASSGGCRAATASRAAPGGRRATAP